MFGPSSLTSSGKPSGPHPTGTKWGLSEVTPGAIALAAMLVSAPLVMYFTPTD